MTRPSAVSASNLRILDMTEWDIRPLGSVAQLNMGQSPAGSLVRSFDKGLPFLQGNAEFGRQCPAPTLQCDVAPRRSAPGDSLISVRAPVGAINRSEREYGIGRGLAAITFDTIDPDFGHYALVEISRDLRSVSQGTTFSAIGRTELAQLQLPIPPLKEQRRIAKILDAVDETIHVSERVVGKQLKLRAGISAGLFGSGLVSGLSENLNLRSLPTPLALQATEAKLTADEILLKDCGIWLSGGTPATSNPDYWDGEIPWITSSSLKVRYLYDSERRLTRAGVEAGSRLVPRGSILFVVRGMSLRNEFRVGMALRSLAFGQDCKALVPADGIDSKYLLFALEAAEDRVLRMVDQASHGTGRLQTSLLSSLKVRLPSWGEQRRVVDILEQADDIIRVSGYQLNKLRKLRAGLASDLLSGRVRTVAA